MSAFAKFVLPACAAFCSVCPPASSAVLDITAFGADPTGGRVSHAEIGKAVAAAKAGDVVLFPKGVYALGRMVWVGEKKGIVLRGEPGAVLRMHCNPRGPESESSGGLRLYRCEDVALEGLTLTTDNPIGCVGRVVATDLKARTLDFRVDAPFPVTGEEHFFQLDTCDAEGAPDGALEVHQKIAPRTNEFGRVVHEGLAYRMVGPRLARITVPGWAPFTSVVTNGHRMLVRYFRGGEGALVLDGVKRLRIEDVEVSRTPSTGCVVLPPSEDVLFRRFCIRMRPDDPNVCASNSDGIHFVGCAGTVTLEDCHFKGLGDDALNVHSLGAEVKSFDAASGAYAFVRRRTDRSETALSPFWAAPGDEMVVYDPATLAKRGTVALATWQAGTGTVARGGVALRPGDYLANARNYPFVRVSGCTVENTRARAFLLQSNRVLVENCRFRGLKSAAVLLACDMAFWNEMGPFESAVVRNCVFEKCTKYVRGHGLGTVAVRAKHDGGPSDYPAGVHRNLRVVGNVFDDVGSSAVYAEATVGVDVSGNVFGRLATDPMPTPESQLPVRLRNCGEVRVTDNVSARSSGASAGEPRAEAPPVPCDPFPDALSALVWRNWGLAPTTALAAVMHVPAPVLAEVAADFGLPPEPAVPVDWKDRHAAALIRRNWPLLPHGRLSALLGATCRDLTPWFAGVKPKCRTVFSTPEAVAGGRTVRRRLAAILKEEGFDPAAVAAACGCGDVPAEVCMRVRAQQMQFAAEADAAHFAAAHDAGDFAEMKRVARRQLARMKEFWPLFLADGRIGRGADGRLQLAPNDILEKVWRCRQAIDAARLAPPSTCRDGKRPYEMVWAGRRSDEVDPVDRLESSAGWTAAGTNAEARVADAHDRLLFGDGTLRFDYRATGQNPVVRLRRAVPLKLQPFDTFSVWVYGNNFYGRQPKGTPMTRLVAEFSDAHGKPFSLRVATILHREWCKFQVKAPKDLLARTLVGGCTFDGFTLTGGTNTEYRRLDLTSVCAFVEELKPLSFRPRAKRGVQVFADQDQGVNTGAGSLPFPTVETTVVPPVSEVDESLEFRTPARPGVWDDLAFRVGKGPWVPLAVGGGVWPRAAADKARVLWRRIGNSLVADVVVKGGEVEELRFGGVGVDLDAKALPLPFYKYGREGWDERPQVVVAELAEGVRFVSATLDWTQSGCSQPFPPQTGEAHVPANGGARYLPKTDGRRNDVYERFVWTVSPKFEETLPFIPNPVSPWRHVTGRSAWTTSGANGDRSPNYETFFWHHRNGLRRLIVTDHETGWRDGDESFTFRTDPAPGRGGDRGQYDYARKLIDGFGYRYGPYNNYTDYAPVNGFFRSDNVARAPDGNWQPAWSRCMAPKPLYAVEMCERLAPEIQRKFAFNTAYCDVHTAVSPWSRTDYDARVPGAGTFTQTFYAYGEIMEIQKRTWNGPVSSEGGHQWMYSGLTDQNYAQDSAYRLMQHPWIVDFDLLRMHPLTCDHGVGFAGMFFGDANVPKGDPWLVVEPWTAATLAFGHSAFLLPENPVYAYYMLLAPASRYSQENVARIRYADGKGRLLTTSEAVLGGEITHNRVVVDYVGGTQVVVNGDPDLGWMVLPRVDGQLALPPWGFFCRSGEVVAFSGWAKGGTNRVDFCRGGVEDGYVFLHGRGVPTEFPGGATDGWLVRRREADGTEEIIPGTKDGAFELALPYAARRIAGLHAASREVVREIAFRVDEKGWTRFRREPGCHSYRAWPAKDLVEPSADAYEAWAMRDCAFRAPKAPVRAIVPRTLPKRLIKGVLTPDGREIPLADTCGGFVREGAATCGGKSQQGLACHPPYLNGAKGAVFARYTVTLGTEDRRFEAEVGKSDHTTPGDGIFFKVGVKVGDEPLKIVGEQHVGKSAWLPISADLSAYAGRKVALYLITDPGANTYGDGSGWSNIRLVNPQAPLVP